MVPEPYIISTYSFSYIKWEPKKYRNETLDLVLRMGETWTTENYCPTTVLGVVVDEDS